MNSKVVVALFCATATAVCGCAELPHKRGDKEFPRAKVMARIKCELADAVTSVAAKQASSNYKSTMLYFNMPKYVATIVLHDQSDAAEAAIFGGSRQSAKDPYYRKFNGGASDFPGLGFTGSQEQYNEAARTVSFKDIISEPVQVDQTYGLVKGDLYKACRASGYTANSREGTVGVGQPLGIAERLGQILEDTKLAPSYVQYQKMHFEFTATIGAGGTISFSHALREETLGIGGNNSFHEEVDIAITENAGG
ncbi:hypothetical protein [Rhizobium anhuiense]|uniref:hypothetical protein n=1 Tax=Rhizobium anhuiense TaxID=1184720 RepID=UPI0020CC2B7A|nr:hypothetical protein [Rhizobium anhuiense]UTS90338.1 hypothetical protein NE851_27615 [Rhizobium anhuiense bv. trifolii]